MSRRSRILLVVTVLFALLNIGGLIMAAVAGEPGHTGIHAVLVLAAGYAASRLVRERLVAD